MAQDWQELTKMIGNEPIVVEKVRLINKDIAVEGSFDLPLLARLTMEDQMFTAAFIQAHGSIKEMERLFGVSYPTIKNRLNKIASQLNLVEIELVGQFEEEQVAGNDTLDRLERGEITAKEAIELLRKQSKE